MALELAAFVLCGRHDENALLACSSGGELRCDEVERSVRRPNAARLRLEPVSGGVQFRENCQSWLQVCVYPVSLLGVLRLAQTDMPPRRGG